MAVLGRVEGMTMTGGCYCGKVRFEAEGPIQFKGQCLCRTCQKLSGGLGNLFFVVGADGFRYTAGEPRSFQKQAGTPSRDFCPQCGTQLTARSHRAPGVVLIKVGTLHDPSVFDAPGGVFWVSEKQAFHHLPPGVPAHQTLPGR
jgi:hypothetical protein